MSDPTREPADPERSRDSHRILLLLGGLALARLILHAATNGAYGFHRDELALLDDSGHLAWGYVAYPPLVPAIGRLALELFGLSLSGIRLFGALAQSIVMVLAGLMARRMGGGAWAVVTAAMATAVAPMSMIMTSLFQYVSFDAMWWVVVAWLVVRIADSGDPRGWVPVGLGIGLGMMTKYTMLFWAVSLAIAVMLTPLRRHLRSPWLWIGVAVSLSVFLPNLIWQIRHDFVSLDFLQAIHERDVRIGRTDGFLSQQLYVTTSALTVPIWIAGCWFLLRSRTGHRFRVLGWMFVIVAALMALSRGRGYYLAPAYPMLFAAGSVALERWRAGMSRPRRRMVSAVIAACLLGAAVSSAILMLPISPIGSRGWELSSAAHDNFREQLGWEELVVEVERIYFSLPEEERERAGIYAGNYGEAGAVNLLGAGRGLPAAFSGINSYWQRGFPQPPPTTVIILGVDRDEATPMFESCEVAGVNRNRHGIVNEESRDHPDILLCRGPRFEWGDVWPELRSFG